MLGGNVTMVGPPPPPPPPPRVENEAPPVAFTDNDGHFEIAGLDAGRYAVSARKAGFVPTTYGSHRAGEPPIMIDLADGVRATVSVRMSRSSGISGRIVDQYGEPVEGVLVQAERLIRTEGRIAPKAAGMATTDDLGAYRIGALPASRYVVNAYVNRAAQDMMFFATDVGGVANAELLRALPGSSQARMYYPGAVGLAGAQPIDLHVGEERGSIDFAVGADTTFPTVTLSFVDADGKAVPADATLAVTSGEIPRFLPVLMRNPKIALRVEPGTWTVLARGNGTVGMAEISATSDASATVVLGKGGRVAGRVESDGAPLQPGRFIVTAGHPADVAVFSRWGNTANGRPNGTFEIDQLLGPIQLRVVAPPKGWALKAILLDGRDITDGSIDVKPTTAIDNVRVVMTNRVATLEGTAVDAQGTTLADYSVLVFPADAALAAHARRYARWARPNQEGRFVVDDLLAGEYFAVATNDVDDAQWQNGDYLERFRTQATKVTLGESDKKTIALPIAPQ